jgi:hypothetical protein
VGLKRAVLASFALAAALGSAPSLSAAAAAPAAQGPASRIGDARLNGFWNIDDAARREALAKVHAELTPLGEEIARKNREHAAERIAKGEPVALAPAICGYLGTPFVIGTSEPWLLVVDEDVVVQVFERFMMPPRYFYTDGRSWPDLSKMPPSSNGWSIAHWEGPTLVIETRGLPPGGTQGGGLKGPKTVLTERVSLSPDGNRLTWTYTWADPELLVRPYSYSIEYDRAPAHTYAYVQACDPNEEPARVVEAPTQGEEAAR